MADCKGIIFDLDGTLIDTLADLAESVNYALGKLNLPTHSVDSYRWRVGNGKALLAGRSLPEDKQHLVDEVAKLLQEHYREHYCDNTRPYPGITDLLRELRKRSIKMAVLSNKPNEFTVELVRRFFGDETFTYVQGHIADEPLKPDPASALAVGKKLSLAPKNIIFLGDSGVDVQTALNAGMMPVGAAWGFRGPEELRQNGCGYIIEQPGQLLELLGNQAKLSVD
jgi:phosphoglycolate phosphatase